MQQDVQNSQPPIVPPATVPKRVSGLKIAGVVLSIVGIVALVAVAGAFFAPDTFRSLVGLSPKTTATATPVVSKTATKTSSPSLSATATQSATASAVQGSQTATSESNAGGTTGSTTCTTADYALDESQCSSQTPEKVCGVIRYVYDNGEEATRSSTFTNVCEYCAQFDANGFLELRGTKMYSKGYSMGQCQ